MVRALIEKGADIKKVVDGGFTPLLMAAEKGHDAVVRALIEADVDINKATDIGMPPLYMAAEFGREAVVLALIKAGADVNKAMDNGATPLSTSVTKKKQRTTRRNPKMLTSLERDTRRLFRFSRKPARCDDGNPGNSRGRDV